MTALRSNTLATFLVDTRTHVEVALERFLPKPPACPPVLSDAMRYSLMAGGKRLRPVLVIAAADTIGRRRKAYCGMFLLQGTGNQAQLFGRNEFFLLRRMDPKRTITMFFAIRP